MKPGAILLNVARGGVIDEAAVADGARARASSAAPAIDVFEDEPPTGSPLLDAPNTLLTPHLGASTAEAQVAVAEEVADQVLDVLAGRPRALRGQRPAADARDGRRRSRRTCRSPRCSAGSSPSSPDRRPDADARDRRRARRVRRRRRSPPRSCAACSRRRRPSGSTSSTRRPSPRPAGSRSSSARRPTPARSRAQLTLSGEVERPDDDGRRARSPAASPASPGSTTTGSTWSRPRSCSSPATATGRG